MKLKKSRVYTYVFIKFLKMNMIIVNVVCEIFNILYLIVWHKKTNVKKINTTFDCIMKNEKKIWSNSKKQVSLINVILINWHKSNKNKQWVFICIILAHKSDVKNEKHILIFRKYKFQNQQLWNKKKQI